MVSKERALFLPIGASAADEQEGYMPEITFDPAKLKVTTYADSGICMAVYDCETEAVFTVNLGEDTGYDMLMPFGCAYLDTNNNPGIDRLLEKAGLAKPYTIYGMMIFQNSGFCGYPLYEFDIERLRAIDPEGVKEYEKTYMEEMRRIENEEGEF